MTLSPDEQSWLAEVEEQVAVALKFSSWGNAAPVLREQFPRLLALVNRLMGENQRLHVELGKYYDAPMLQAVSDERDHLRSQLEVAKKAMSKPYACTRCGERSDVKWGRSCEADEGACCKWEMHLNPALAAIEGEGKP